MSKLLLVLTAIFCLLQAGQAHAGWGSGLGDLLTNLPVVDVVGEKILENRVVFVDLNGKASDSNQLQVRRDQKSAPSVRRSPETGLHNKVVAQTESGNQSSAAKLNHKNAGDNGFVVRPDLNSVANVRRSPGTHQGNKVIAQLRPGETVSVISKLENKAWLYITLQSGRNGYIHESLVLPTDVSSQSQDAISYLTTKKSPEPVEELDADVTGESVAGAENSGKGQRNTDNFDGIAAQDCKNQLLRKGTKYYLDLAAKINLNQTEINNIEEIVASEVKISLLSGGREVHKDPDLFISEKIYEMCWKYKS
ncbi:hypothetical protein DIT71_17385 [Marinobacter vulgaris]|uniref:SH3b domain-containing protein n=1 Tax=Marinobacter vulgaris TaxID=1928331 RepID=A0A2V3ZG30_9GAMM|nr:SH3 domain-containing protein [Marinobacter vulgaris]PXX88381.1 hypothetical protein DIT71_17385 [Marinobacter vulgaris]TSJ66152.1 SH3 domain-containing protein [Marinobacter vulgaris]